MGNAEAIEILDIAISQVNACCNLSLFEEWYVKQEVNNVRKIAMKAVKQVGCSSYVLWAIKDISFDFQFTPSFGSSLISHPNIREEVNAIYKQGVHAIINILQQERSRILQAKNDEEHKENIRLQTKNNKIQYWTLAFSAIAAIGGIISLFITIFR